MTITGATRVYGLIGDPVAHSLSPVLINDAFARLNVDAVYTAWPVAPDAVGEALSGLAALGIAGVSVTYPHKAAVLSQLVSCSPAVTAIGAANVLTLGPDGHYRGDNTDAGGTALALQELLDWEVAGRRVVILGAGGAGRAAAHGLLTVGAGRVDVLVREPARAEPNLAGLRAAHPDASLTVAALGSADATTSLHAADLVVQATTVGLADPEAAPLVSPAAAPDAVAFELVYGARPTAFAAAWRRTGRACLDGRDLLAAQAHLALRIWLGEAPDLASMRRLIAEEDA